jgi:hypothetical protein
MRPTLSVALALLAFLPACRSSVLVRPGEVPNRELGGAVHLRKVYPVEAESLDGCGVAIVGAKSGYHVQDGRAYWLVRARVENTGSKEIQRFDVAIRLFDAYAQEVYGKRWWRNQPIEPGQSTIDAFSDFAYGEAKAAVRGEVTLLRVAYADGTSCPAEVP